MCAEIARAAFEGMRATRRRRSIVLRQGSLDFLHAGLGFTIEQFRQFHQGIRFRLTQLFQPRDANWIQHRCGNLGRWPAARRTSQRGVKLRDVQWLREIIIHARAQTMLAVALQCVRRNSNDINRCSVRRVLFLEIADASVTS